MCFTDAGRQRRACWANAWHLWTCRCSIGPFAPYSLRKLDTNIGPYEDLSGKTRAPVAVGSAIGGKAAVKEQPSPSSLGLGISSSKSREAFLRNLVTTPSFSCSASAHVQ